MGQFGTLRRLVGSSIDESARRVVSTLSCGAHRLRGSLDGVGSARYVRHLLLTEADSVLEVAGLGCVRLADHRVGLWLGRVAQNQRPVAREVDCILLLVRCVEVDEVARREVHVLHLVVLVAQVHRGDLNVLSLTGSTRLVPLENKLRLRHVARAVSLESLVLVARLWLFALAGVRSDAWRVDQWQLLLVGKCIGEYLLARDFRRDQLHGASRDTPVHSSDS